jgi:hypothetical protein
MKVTVRRKSRTFGDACLACLFTRILCDNGIDAVLKLTGRSDIYSLFDCPNYNRDYRRAKRFQFSYEDNRSQNFIKTAIEKFRERYKILVSLTRTTVPVHYTEMNIQPVDIVLGTKTGGWTRYRNWPYWERFKEMLNDNKLSFIDLDKNEIRGMACLNYVKHCKAYVGLDTGMSHYVSSVAGGKTLILQSGFNKFEHWSTYDYKYLSYSVPCSPCNLQKGCPISHECMVKLTPEMVFKSLTEML